MCTHCKKARCALRNCDYVPQVSFSREMHIADPHARAGARVGKSYYSHTHAFFRIIFAYFWYGDLPTRHGVYVGKE